MKGNFDKFGDSLQICQNFTCQLLVIFEKAIEVGLKFTNVDFAKCNIVCDFPKFSAAEISFYTALPS